MIGQLPPFALSPAGFRFKALASHAGRASLGGDREVAFACFATARLASAMLPPFMLAAGDASARAVCARQWLASLAVPTAARASLNAVIDAISGGNRRTVAKAIADLAEVGGPQLDVASANELNELASELGSQDR